MEQVTEFSRPEVRIRVDLNALTPDGLLRARRSRADGFVAPGDAVTVFEPDDDVRAPARVERVSGDFLYLDVSWDEMTDDVLTPVVQLVSSPGPHSLQRTGSLGSRVRTTLAVTAMAGAAVIAPVVTANMANPPVPHGAQLRTVSE